MGGFTSPPPTVATLLSVSTAVAFKGGAPGAGGAANDTILLRVLILKNAGPCTLTIGGGLKNDAGTQDTSHIVLTGSSSVDTLYTFEPGIINTAGALSLTASVANMVLVQTQAAQQGYSG